MSGGRRPRRASRATARAACLAAAATLLAAALAAVPAAVHASVPADTEAIAVTAGTLSTVTVSSSPGGVQTQPKAFDTATHDYALRACANTGKSLTFALSGSGLRVGTQSGSTIDVSLSTTAGEAVVVTTASTQYWFRCLPSDFPPITVATHGSPSPGWYLTAVNSHNSASGTSVGTGLYAMILDANGTPVWFSTQSTLESNFQQLTGSTFSWGFFQNGNPPFVLYRDDTQTYTTLGPQPTSHWSGLHEDSHELLHLANGDFMMLASPVTPNSVTFTDASGTSHTGPIVDCVIEELNAAGGLVWSWDAYYDHHISPSETFLGGGGTGAAYDVYHCNSLDIDPAASNPSLADVLLSARNVDAIYKINRASGLPSGKVLWKLGDDHATGTQLTAAQTTGSDHEPLLSTTFLTGEDTFGGQHDARFQSGGISFYDDHTGQPTTSGGARGVVMSVDGTHDTATESAEFPAPDSGAPAFATGSFRPNAGGTGDNVVGWGFRNDLAMSEFDNSTPPVDVRDIYFNTSASAPCGPSVGPSGTDCYYTYRFLKLAPSAFNIDLLRATVGVAGCQTAGTGCRSATHGAGWNPPQELTLEEQFGTSGLVTGAGTSPASPGSGWVDTFWKGTDNNLWHTWTFDGGKTYSGPFSLGSGPLGGSPHAVSSSPGHLDVFWRGKDNGLWHNWYSSAAGWSGPQSLGAAGSLAGDPYPVVFKPTGIDVFWKGTDGNLWHRWYSSQLGWAGPASLGYGPLGSDPHPVALGTDSLNVFWEGADRNLWFARYDDTHGWVGPLYLGSGPLNSEPHPVSSAPGVVDVFWRGTEQGLWHDWFINGSGWTGPARISGAGPVVFPPMPVSSAANYIDVLWRTLDPHSGATGLDEARYVPGSGWSVVASPSTTALTTDPSPIQASAGEIAVFARSFDGNFWFQTNTGTGSAPQ